MSKLRKQNISVGKGLKKNTELGLDYTEIERRWDAMCEFVDNAEAYGVDSIVKYDLGWFINTIRKQQCPLPTEYQVSTHDKAGDDKKVKIAFNKRDVLFEFEKYIDFAVHEEYKNLQAKFYFNNAQELTKVSYQETRESQYPFSDKVRHSRVRKVIDLQQQKQADQEAATEMTK